MCCRWMWSSCDSTASRSGWHLSCFKGGAQALPAMCTLWECCCTRCYTARSPSQGKTPRCFPPPSANQSTSSQSSQESIHHHHFQLDSLNPTGGQHDVLTVCFLQCAVHPMLSTGCSSRCASCRVLSTVCHSVLCITY